MQVGTSIQYNGNNWTILEIDGDSIHLIHENGEGICVLITEINNDNTI